MTNISGESVGHLFSLVGSLIRRIVDLLVFKHSNFHQETNLQHLKAGDHFSFPLTYTMIFLSGISNYSAKDIWCSRRSLATRVEHPQLQSSPHVLGTMPSAGPLTNNPVHMPRASLTMY